MKSRLAALAVATSAIILTGCSGPSASDDLFGDDPLSEDIQDLDTPPEGAFSYGHITSCDQVEAVVSEFIDGLVASDLNNVTEWGVSCTWDTAEGETDFANVRTVEVILEPSVEKPDPSIILQLDDTELIEDSWLDANDGIAYSASFSNAVSGVIANTVWLPGVQATVVGGKWAEMSPLDGPAAVAIVKELLG